MGPPERFIEKLIVSLRSGGKPGNTSYLEHTIQVKLNVDFIDLWFRWLLTYKRGNGGQRRDITIFQGNGEELETDISSGCVQKT